MTKKWRLLVLLLACTAFLSGGLVLLTPGTEAGGPVSCGPCGPEYINEYCQICWKVRCSNQPPNVCGPAEMCMDFAGGCGGGGGDEEM